MAKNITSLLLFTTLLSTAETPTELYARTCAACHGPNGEGAAGGTFPPLAKSEWLHGTPDRSIQIVLHGIQGPITVLDKDYDLGMPPHEASLTDEQIATILTHVRSSFGNKEKPVTTTQVLNARKLSSKREEPWTADELLKIHPLLAPSSPLIHLISRTYKGTWNTLPDFDKLKPDAIEEEQNNLISLRHHLNQKKFGIVWIGEIEVPATGKYTFHLDSDDGSRILIDDKEILKIDKVGPMGRKQKATVQLTKGLHKFRTDYFEKTGDKGLIISWSGPGIKRRQFLTETIDKKKKGPSYPPIDLTPKADEAVIYNNFLAGTTPRALGVGYPQGQNIAYSTQNCAPEFIWKGKFIDAGIHWTNRGKGSQKPSSQAIAPLTQSSPYQLSGAPKLTPQFYGYTLDKNHYPTFKFTIGETTFIDEFAPSSDRLKRTLTINSPKPQTLKLDIHSGQNKLDITISEKPVSPVKNKVINIPLKDGKNTLTITYTWK